jgi:hypothetical protein
MGARVANRSSLRYVISVPCTLAVFFYTTNSETVQFEVAFQDASSKVMDAMGKSIFKTIAAVDVFATLMVSHARSTNQTWPFILFPDFALR